MRPQRVPLPESRRLWPVLKGLDDVVVEGFTFGKITDFDAEPCDMGDAFVIAPDGSRAGLVWEVGEKSYFRQVRPFESER